jgi:3-oxoacyl-[acyl-carrier protein] reductase
VKALVTGVSRRAGIGFAIASRLLADGHEVFIQGWTAHDRGHDWGGEPEGTEAVAQELGVPFIEADFADPEAPARVVQAARDALGPLEILVANHARSGHAHLPDMTAEQLDSFLHENVRGTLLLVKELAAQFEGDAGRVIMMTSGQHLGPMARELAYAVSKGAIQQATMTLADELAPRGITVNTVNPGPTDTGWGLGDERPDRQMPFGRWGEPDDAARLISWLCSDEGRWITGQTINSEGGFRRWG